MIRRVSRWASAICCVVVSMAVWAAAADKPAKNTTMTMKAEVIELTLDAPAEDYKSLPTSAAKVDFIYTGAYGGFSLESDGAVEKSRAVCVAPDGRFWRIPISYQTQNSTYYYYSAAPLNLEFAFSKVIESATSAYVVYIREIGTPWTYRCTASRGSPNGPVDWCK